MTLQNKKVASMLKNRKKEKVNQNDKNNKFDLLILKPTPIFCFLNWFLVIFVVIIIIIIFLACHQLLLIQQTIKIYLFWFICIFDYLMKFI